jgi:hypothetical protein
MEKMQSKLVHENIPHQEQQTEEWKIVILQVQCWTKIKYEN